MTLFKKLFIALTFGLATLASAQTNPALGGIYQADSFANWSSPPGNLSPYSWSNSDACYGKTLGLTFPMYVAGVPIQITDANPALSEVATVNSVYTNNQCSITLNAVNSHTSFSLSSATAGFREALNYAVKNGGGTVVLTPRWASLGGTTAMITAAPGITSVGISDQRTALTTAYLWNGSAYVAQSSGGSGTVTKVVDASGLLSIANPTTVPTFTYNAVPANTILAGPASGGNTAPFFRALGVSDLPATTLSAAGTPTTGAIAKWVTSNTIGNSNLNETTGNFVLSGNGTGGIVNSTPTQMATALTTATATPLQSALFDKSSGAYIPSGGLSNPANIIGLYYFDAADYSGGTGTILHDHSGNGNDCTIPTGAGAPTWTVDGEAFALTYPATGETQLTGIECPGITSPATMQAVTIYQLSDINSSRTRSLFGYSATPGILLSENGVTLPAATNRWNLFFSRPSGLTTTGPTGNTGYNFVSWGIGGTNDQYWINDTQQYAVNGISNTAIPTGGHLEIGTSHCTACNGNSVLYKASIYAIAVYSSQLTSAQTSRNFTAFKSYFSSRGINIGAPAFNFTTPVPYNVICDTTSIDAGTGGGTAPCSLMSLGTNYTVQVAAIPSSTIHQKLASALAFEKSLSNPSSSNLIIFGGPITNDLCGNSTLFTTPTPVQAWGYMAQAITLAQSLGFKVGVGTMISRTGSGTTPNNASTCDQLKNTWNALARTNTASTGAFLMDIAEIPGLGADGSYANPSAACGGSNCFIADGVHPTLAGETTYAAGEQAVIQANTSPFSSSIPNSQAGATYSMTPLDRYILAPITAASAWNLPDCSALTGYDYNVLNTSASFAVTLSGVSGQTIAGPNVIPAGAIAKFTVQLIAASTGGCSWTSQLTQSNAASFSSISVSGDVKVTGNVNVQGTVNSTINTLPASITNSGVALTANPNVADEVYYDSTQTANNRIVEAIWFQGAYQLRFKNDSQASALAALQITGGQASGVTGITSTSGSGNWVHTGGFQATSLSVGTNAVKPVFSGTGVTTASTTLAVTVTGVTSGMACWFAPTNLLAATTTPTPYITSSTNTITLNWAAATVASQNFNVFCQ